MPTEGASTISELTPASPTAAGPAGEGDDELRQLKTVLVASFPALDGLIENVGALGGIGDTNPPDAATFTKLFADVRSALAAGNGVPVGSIVMWAGSEASVPVGWALCDGTNGTPNLIDRFIIGSNDASRFPTGTTAGSEWADGVSPPQNFTKMGGDGTGQATINIPDHIIAEANIPEHDHFVWTADDTAEAGSDPSRVGTGQSTASRFDNNNGPYAYNAYGGASPATLGPTSTYGNATPAPLQHPPQDVTIDGIEHSHQYLPACYSLAYIQFIGA